MRETLIKLLKPKAKRYLKSVLDQKIEEMSREELTIANYLVDTINVLIDERIKELESGESEENDKAPETAAFR